ncbi:MAG: hypothetical protein AAGI70_12635 [Pseudomonadota bacterium]
MTIRDVADLTQRHFVESYRIFIADQLEIYEHGGPEVKLEQSEASRLFKRLYCADMVVDDGEWRIIEHEPSTRLTFEPFRERIGSCLVEMRGLEWQRCVVGAYGIGGLDRLIEGWFDYWFDLEEARYPDDASPYALSSVIHSVLIEGTQIYLDLGSAEPRALTELIELMATAGASRLVVNSG